MIDRAYVVWYEKSVSDPQAIVASGYKVTRDYTKSIEIETEYVPVTRCVFKPGSATMMVRDHYTTGIFYNRRIHFKEGWKFSSSIYTLMGKHYFTYYSYQSIESVVKSVQGNQFQYAPWKGYAKKNFDLIVLFAAFARYPCIEYLEKLGMHEFVDRIVNKEGLHKTINPKGKTLEKILGLSKREFRDWRESGVKLNPRRLHAYKWFRERGIILSWKTVARCEHLTTGSHYIGAMNKILELTTLERLIRYAESQARKRPNHFSSVNFAITTWRDYLEECKKLQMDVREERFLFPNNLYAAHQKNIGKITLKEDPELDQMIVRRQPSLKKFEYEQGDFLIRPIANLEELFDEGGELVHCIGSYADRYAEGKIAILCIRKKNEPNKPFYTLELGIPSLSVMQCRGIENCKMTEEVNDFVKQFVARKLATKPGRRIDTTGLLPDRQEAVV